MRTWLSLSAYSGMFVFGIVLALLGATLPLLVERIHFDLARAGTLFLAMNCAMLITMLGLGPLMDRFGEKPPMVLGPFLVALAVWMISRASHFPVLLIGVALLGIGGGALNGATNTLVADLHSDPKRKSAALNLLGVFFGFGAVFLPFTVGWLLKSVGLDRILYFTTALCLVPAALSVMLAFPPSKHQRRVPLAEAARLLRNPLVLTFACLLFFESGNEFILGGYTTSYLTKELHSTISTASYLLAGYWAAVMVARVVLSRILLTVKGSTTIQASALLAIFGIAMLLATGGELVALLALAVIGFGVASIFPTTLGLAGSHFEEHSGTVFGILFAIALSGGMSLPWLVGQIGDVRGLQWAFLVPIAGFLTIFLLQRRISKLSQL